MAEMANISYNIGVGICKVIFEVEGKEPLVIEETQGGVKLKISTNKHDVKMDKFGDTPIKSISKGTVCQSEVPLLLYDLKKFSQVMPMSKLVEDASDPAKQKLEGYSKAGSSLNEIVGKLTCIPFAKEATPNDYVTIPYASPLTDIEWSYDNDNERIAKITFIAYPDVNGLLYFFGDETASESTTP